MSTDMFDEKKVQNKAKLKSKRYTEFVKSI